MVNEVLRNEALLPNILKFSEVTKNVQPKSKPSKTKRTEKKASMGQQLHSFPPVKFSKSLVILWPVVFQSTDDGWGVGGGGAEKSSQ